MEIIDTPFMDNNRIICASEYFDYALYKYTVERLLQFDKHRYDENNVCRDIAIYIDSCGGDTACFLGLYDIINNILYSDVCTICTSYAASSAALLLLSGTKGKRFCTPNATIMLHDVKTSASYLTDTCMESLLRGFLGAHKKRIEDIILKRTKISKKQLKEIMSKDTWLSAEECLKLGIIDHIIRKPDDLYTKINI